VEKEGRRLVGNLGRFSGLPFLFGGENVDKVASKPVEKPLLENAPVKLTGANQDTPILTVICLSIERENRPVKLLKKTGTELHDCMRPVTRAVLQTEEPDRLVMPQVMLVVESLDPLGFEAGQKYEISAKKV
jgi:hypothetical protein